MFVTVDELAAVPTAWALLEAERGLLVGAPRGEQRR